MPEFKLVEVAAVEQMPVVRELFQEYADWLKVDLCFQGFTEELENLPGRYSRPSGLIIIARSAGKAAGCIALKPLAEGICEMKRLYVRPEFRDHGIGTALVRTALDEAKRMGYRCMRLDTMAQMEAAIRMYQAHGFEEIPSYYDNPHEGVVYMERCFGGW
jgi:carbonic anhydrase